MPSALTPTPHDSCPLCGYDMRPLLAAGIVRCPECGSDVPRGLFVHLKPMPRQWYYVMLPLALAPGLLFIAVWLALQLLPGSGAMNARRHLLFPWMLVTPVYCYVYTWFFCASHGLPRAGFGAIPVSIPLVIVNYILAVFVEA